jgi:hypothetical protein
MSVAVNSHRARSEEREEEIEVDNLKNVPSLAIFYWFLLWLARLEAVKKKRTKENSRFSHQAKPKSELLQSMKVFSPLFECN